MKITTKEIILVSLFTALTAIGAFISIPLGSIPITLQSLFTILAGLFLGPKLGALSQIIYILFGLSGMRIFANFSGGPQYIFAPSFGFLIGFIPAAYLVGKIAHSDRKTSFIKLFLASCLANMVIYLLGIPYMYMILNYLVKTSMSFSQVIKVGCLVFLPGDLLKIGLASLIGTRVATRVKILDP